jgi:hypothetical protein
MLPIILRWLRLPASRCSFPGTRISASSFRGVGWRGAFIGNLFTDCPGSERCRCLLPAGQEPGDRHYAWARIRKLSCCNSSEPRLVYFPSRFAAALGSVFCYQRHYRVATNCGTPARLSNSSSVSRTDAAATFSSKCSIELVPGIGIITGLRRSSHASAICIGVA